MHWAFAVVHGFAAFAYLRRDPIGKLWVVLTVLAGQLAWAAFVAWRARAARIGAW
jgi:hypothetical protein